MILCMRSFADRFASSIVVVVVLHGFVHGLHGFEHGGGEHGFEHGGGEHGLEHGDGCEDTAFAGVNVCAFVIFALPTKTTEMAANKQRIAPIATIVVRRADCVSMCSTPT